MTKLLEVTNLHTRFKIRDGYLYAVNGVSFSVDKGEMLGVVGESGCGKSVSMMSLIRLLPPAAEITAGTVVLDGEDIAHASKARINAVRGSKVGVIFQDPMTSLNPFMKIGAQLIEGILHHKKISKAEATKQAAKYLELVGISNPEHRLTEYPHQLSGGMRQRVMIAMALLGEPELVIADEPTTALDVTIQAQIVELVKGLREKLDMSIIWITHDLSLLAGMVDRIVVMYGGLIVEEAELDEIYKNPGHPYTIGLLKSIPSLKTEAGSRLPSIAGAPPNLVAEPKGCPFAPRCAFRLDRCEAEMPKLEDVPGGTPDALHRVACWVDVKREGALQ